MGGIECLNTALTLKGLYLPKISSDCINANYLLGAALNMVFNLSLEKSGHGIAL